MFRIDDYHETCLIDDAGEDMIYQLVVDEEVEVRFTLYPNGTYETTMGLDDACPPDPTYSQCIAVSDVHDPVPHGFVVGLLPGTYYLMVDTESAGCIPSFTLRIEPNHACCFADGHCEMLTEAECNGQGGMWHSLDCGEGVVCPQPPGACCLLTGECLMVPPDECWMWGIPVGGDCDPNPCPPPYGACCYADGGCEYLQEASCTGSWLGSGSYCDVNPCPQPSIACCFADGTCQELTAAACTAQGGDPQAYPSNCAPNPCPQPTGACCMADYACQELTEAACLSQAGRFRGVGTACTGPQVCGCKGDCNCDGVVDFDDINAFVAAISGFTPCNVWNCDVDDNGLVDFDDISPFVWLLSQGAECP